MAAVNPLTLVNKHQNYSEDVLQNLQVLRLEEALCDIVLVSNDGVRVPCHRVVLAARSPYFKAMFTSSMLESEAREIPLSEVEAEELLPLTDFCYTGKIELPDEDAAVVQKLLRTALYLQLDSAVEACSQFFQERLMPSNCFGTRALADQFYLVELRNATERYIDEHFTEIVENDEFFALSAQQVSDLISRDELRVSSEEVIFESVVAWIEHGEGRREFYIHELLKWVRMHFLQHLYMSKRVIPICTKNRCLHLGFSTPREIKPRKWQSEELITIFKTNEILSFQKFCPIDETWQTFPKNTECRTFGTVIINKKLYLIGGRLNRQTYDGVECYDWATQATRQLAKLGTPRERHSVAILNGLIYAVGGFQLKSCESYDLDTDAWSPVESMQEERSNFGLVALDGHLHAFGGNTGSCIPKHSHECYDPNTNQWTFRANMLEPRFHHAVAVSQGFIYSVGGYNGYCYTNTVQRYDPRFDIWSNLMPWGNPGPRQRIVCYTFAGRLRVVRRNTIKIDNQWSARVDEYHPETNLWRIVMQLRTSELDYKVLTIMT